MGERRGERGEGREYEVGEGKQGGGNRRVAGAERGECWSNKVSSRRSQQVHMYVHYTQSWLATGISKA